MSLRGRRPPPEVVSGYVDAGYQYGFDQVSPALRTFDVERVRRKDLRFPTWPTS
ncbi:MAG: hypothetical protein U0599_06895 [Vicinamibacteria bacterium]